MIIATWNINSIRLRIDHLKTLLANTDADIICLQEIKVIDELFPFQALHELGFPHIVTCGEKGYNGVAILSRMPLFEITKMNFGLNQACRHISAKLSSGVEIHNIYVPAGGDIPDPNLNPKFADKLEFFDQLTNWMSKERSIKDKLIMLGDFNVAPLEHDVWSHKQLKNVVSHTAIEIEKLAQLQASVSFVDVSRKFVPDSEKLYSWWSYRNKDWQKSNRGRRLDHIWVSPSLESHLRDSHIIKLARDWVLPSDHVPVLAMIDI